MPRKSDPSSVARLKLLAEAEKLFAARGLAAVKLRDIAVAAGLHHASIYHYFPGGKEQIYVDVMTASFHEHRRGLEEAIAAAPGGLRAQLYAVADWFTSHPPVDGVRMALADFPALPADSAAALAQLAYDSLREPIVAALDAASARERGALSIADRNQAAMALVTLVQSAHTVPERYLPTEQKAALGRSFVDMLMDGWTRRD
jgi:AcrR family transcriptional regulator